MEASEEKQSPVILAIHPDELSFVTPAFVASAVEEANKATVPVCIHLDHGAILGQVMEAIQCGFTSVMIDASMLPLEENIAICKEVVALAHSVNVSVEGELGTIGTTGPEAEPGADVIIYTNPDDVVIFVEATGVDTLGGRHRHLAWHLSERQEARIEAGPAEGDCLHGSILHWFCMAVRPTRTTRLPRP